MDALVFNEQLYIDTAYPRPTLRANEAIIRPHLLGICNTDIEITHGYKGFRGVLGHEFVGTVEAATDRAWIGRRVVGEINAYCADCATSCALGGVEHCPKRTTLGIKGRDGAMAEAFALPIACLHEVPASVPDTAAVFVEPLAAALEILQAVHIRPTDRVAVVGDGKLGALIVQVVRLPGCSVTLIGRHPERWALFQRQGIACRHSSDLPPTGYDVVIDCTGQVGGLDTARQLVRPRGRLVLKSTFHHNVTLNLSALVVDEIEVIGSRCGPFAPALRLLERGLVEVEPLISAVYPLRDAVAAFAAARGQLKVMLQVSPDQK
ncbi:MAG: alcohol dehydrogenase catalytic domain-containing protein [Chloroflexaceae bacterium]|nr:alcohol dehydrogenase catalytic domain-containing protein [Chloroflexaceae bacterium]NJO04099.1 alcohol dehydrogenase catalytic domain-containing protein [Chloroflexaceae bacterium]